MKTTLSLLLLGALTLLRADVISTTLGNTLSPGGSDVVGSGAGTYQTASQLFESLATYSLGDVQVGISSNSTYDTGVDVMLYTDVWAPLYYSHGQAIYGHQVGTFIGQVGVVNASASPSLQTATEAGSLSLGASTYYWIQLQPDTLNTLVTWDQETVTNDQALQVDGSLATTASPEPAVIMLAGLGLCGLALTRKRATQNPAAVDRTGKGQL